jgi:5-methylcytosine-specific restriction endonuclease McrA
MNNFPLVLALDVAGRPGRWIDYKLSAYYYSKDMVAWEMAPVTYELHGGKNAKTGMQSTLTIDTIIAIKGRISKKNSKHTHVPPLSNKALFRRDLNICAYCGEKFRTSNLQREHVIPKAQGGRDIWTNVVAACGNCNKMKNNRTPEQAGMELLFVPYAPNHHEWLILENRRILIDQMQYLLKGVPDESRLHLKNLN